MMNIVAKKKVFFIISAVIILCGIISMAVQGLNFDIDFTGGTAMDIRLGTEYTQAVEEDLKAIIKDTVGKDAQIQKTGNGDEAYIKTQTLSTEEREQIFTAIAEKYDLTQEDLVSTDNVGQTMSQTILWNALKALVIAILLMLVYIAIRFSLASGVSAVIALAHDVLVMLSVYSIFRLPINSSFIAAVLTIVGYSINATIIVFDRVREERKNVETFDEAVNAGVKKSVTRAIYTSLTTLFTIGALYFLGVDDIQEFAFPIIIGIVAGAYSSLFLAGSLWSVLHKKFHKSGKAVKKSGKNPYKK